MKEISKKNIFVTVDGEEKSFFMTNSFAVIERILKIHYRIKPTVADFVLYPSMDSEIIDAMEKNDALYAVDTEGGKIYFYNKKTSAKPYLMRYKYAFVLKDDEEKAAIERVKSSENGRKFYYALLRAFETAHEIAGCFSEFRLCWALVNELGIKLKIVRYAKFINTNTECASFFSSLGYNIQDFINEGHKISEIYKNANMTKQTFSRIRSAQIAHPSFESVLQLAIGLKMQDTRAIELADSLGYEKELSSDACKIVLKHLENKNYDIEEINKELFEKCGIKLGERGKKREKK